MPVEGLLEISDVLDVDDAPHRDLLPLLVIGVAYRHPASCCLLLLYNTLKEKIKTRPMTLARAGGDERTDAMHESPVS